jgi:hypothetical protein
MTYFLSYGSEVLQAELWAQCFLPVGLRSSRIMKKTTIGTWNSMRYTRVGNILYLNKIDDVPAFLAFGMCKLEFGLLEYKPLKPVRVRLEPVICS